MPASKIEEYAERFVLKIDIPGVDVNTVEITLEQGILAMVGDRSQDHVEKDVQRRRIERPTGRSRHSAGISVPSR